jgi:hypothetical protein
VDSCLGPAPNRPAPTDLLALLRSPVPAPVQAAAAVALDATIKRRLDSIATEIREVRLQYIICMLALVSMIVYFMVSIDPMS